MKEAATPPAGMFWLKADDNGLLLSKEDWRLVPYGPWLSAAAVRETIKWYGPQWD